MQEPGAGIQEGLGPEARRGLWAKTFAAGYTPTPLLITDTLLTAYCLLITLPRPRGSRSPSAYPALRQ
jgi:hypothetical protein